jgi:RNA polymerase sigma-70 factor (ECF subfamily)
LGLLPTPLAFSCELFVSAEHITAALQRYVNALAEDKPAKPIARALLDRVVCRLRLLCANLLYRQYQRLTLPPLNLQPDEIIGVAVERLLKAMGSVRPEPVRQFFALVNQQLRWELNALARRLEEQVTAVKLHDLLVPGSSDTALTPDGRHMLASIDHPPEDDQEEFGLMPIQGLTQGEAPHCLASPSRNLNGYDFSSSTRATSPSTARTTHGTRTCSCACGIRWASRSSRSPPVPEW